MNVCIWINIFSPSISKEFDIVQMTNNINNEYLLSITSFSSVLGGVLFLAPCTKDYSICSTHWSVKECYKVARFPVSFHVCRVAGCGEAVTSANIKHIRY